MEQCNLDSDKMLDRYIYDYMLKRDLLSSARAFLTEGKVETDREVVDVPRGYLLEWWSKFRDNYITRSNEKGSDSTAAHIEMAQTQNPSSQMAPKQNVRKRKQCSNQIDNLETLGNADFLEDNVDTVLSPDGGDNVDTVLSPDGGDNVDNVLSPDGGEGKKEGILLGVEIMEQSNWDSDKILDRYIYDYILKRNLHSSASAFLTEGELSTDTEVVDLPGGVLLEWWSKFRDIYITRSNGKASDSTAAYIEDNLETLGNAGFLEDNADTFLSSDGGEVPGFLLGEVGCIRTENKFKCCHFSSDGKFLATAGHDKKAVLWNLDTLGIEHTLEQHQGVITDVRFRPESTQLATSSLDKSVRIWDAANPGYCLHAYTGHTAQIMSLDFHPNQNDLFCFCDTSREVHYWSINPFSRTRVSKQSGRAYVRFQPINGHLLAAATDNVVSVYDVESDKQTHSLEGHSGMVRYLCWDLNGDRLASVSRDCIKIWSLASGECIRELMNENRKQFDCCVFHHLHSDVLVMGGLQGMGLWSVTENKIVPMPTREELVGALAQSPQTGMIASACHNGVVKLWR